MKYIVITEHTKTGAKRMWNDEVNEDMDLLSLMAAYFAADQRVIVMVRADMAKVTPRPNPREDYGG